MINMFNKGFIHGRFQIFHNDHLSYALAAKELCNLLIVGITSPDPSVSPHEEIDPHRSNPSANPFTFYERLEMIKSALIVSGMGLSDFNIVPLPIGKPELIGNYVPQDAVSFFTIYDEWGYEKVKRISEMGYKTHVLWHDRQKGISGTEIRSRIASGRDWKKYVPISVCDYMENTGLVNKVVDSNL